MNRCRNEGEDEEKRNAHAPILQGPCGRAGRVSRLIAISSILLVIGRADANTLDFCVSTGTDPRLDGNGSSHDLLRLVRHWEEDELTGDDSEFGNYQNLNFVSQCNGALFMVRTHRDSTTGNDFIDLFRVTNGDGNDVAIEKVAKKHLTCSGNCVQLDGQASILLEGGPLTLSWQAAGVTFDDATSATPIGSFPFAQTNVSLTVSDGTNSDSDVATIKIVDTIAPTIACPANVVADATMPSGAIVNYPSPTAADSCSANDVWYPRRRTSRVPAWVRLWPDPRYNTNQGTVPAAFTREARGWRHSEHT